MLEQVHIDLVLGQRQIGGVIVTKTCDLQFDAILLGLLFEYFPGFLFRVGGANADGGFAIGAGGIAVAGAGDQAGGGYNGGGGGCYESGETNAHNVKIFILRSACI